MTLYAIILEDIKLLGAIPFLLAGRYWKGLFFIWTVDVQLFEKFVKWTILSLNWTFLAVGLFHISTHETPLESQRVFDQVTWII